VKLKIDGIEPEAGPTSGKIKIFISKMFNVQKYLGETRVLVRGGPFTDLQLYFPKPMVTNYTI
jgi:hypothetical protein